MPNFLGSQSWFTKNFARPISNGQLPGASAESISDGMEKLKLLHQQVLPFILRREKEYVMKELPPKCIIDIPCELTSEQQCIYETFCHGTDAKRAVAALRSSIDNARHSQGANGSTKPMTLAVKLSSRYCICDYSAHIHLWWRMASMQIRALIALENSWH